MTDDSPYKQLALRLDELPNGYPPTEDGVELRILAKLFSPEEAALAAQLRLTPETPAEVAERIGGDPKVLRKQLKGLAKRGLIKAQRTDCGLGYGLMPFVVGFYEHQVDTIDAEFARLFEDYYQQSFGQGVSVTPAFHRVIPVRESLDASVEVKPYESAVELVDAAQAWGVLDCICRKQQALIGNPCEHPREVCMTFSSIPGAFDGHRVVRALTREEALDTLRLAAEAGLVHTVGNRRDDMWYICNCCTCGCGILRGIAGMGMPTAAARSAFVNQVDEGACIACGECVERCPFGALSLDDVAQVDPARCLGCGVCVLVCPADALQLVRRPEAEIEPVPENESEWLAQRAAARGLDLDRVL